MELQVRQSHLFFDPCARKHGGNTESVIAYEKARAHAKADRDKILRVVKLAGLGGITSKEIGAILDVPINCFSGRITELLADNLIYRTEGERRAGAAVLRAK